MTAIERLTSVAAKLKTVQAAAREYTVRHECEAARNEILRAIAQLRAAAGERRPQ